MEAEVVPAFAAREEAAHRAHFWKAVDEKKYCCVDTEKVVCDPAWRDFFLRL